MKQWLNLTIFSYALVHLIIIGYNVFCLIVIMCCLIEWNINRKINLEINVKVNDKSSSR